MSGLLLGAVHCGPAREKAPSDAEVTPSTDSVSQNAQAGLGGTSWRLVKFQGSDETTLTPADGAEYTIAFEPGGRLTARIDCNRGRGTWKSSGPPQLEFGPLALTRAMCPPGSLHDHIVKQWPYVRSYVIRDGHLFLSLMADGGIYEFEPMSPVTVASGQPEPHLILNSMTGRATGSGGCNRMTGSYELSGDRLSLGQMAGTLMACTEGMETERAFLDALGRVKGWRIAGQQLELLDAAGNMVARFEAHHME